MIALRDSEGKVWGVFVYHNGSERVLYTKIVDPELYSATTSYRVHSFDGPYDLMVGTDGTLYTYLRNKRR